MPDYLCLLPPSDFPFVVIVSQKTLITEVVGGLVKKNTRREACQAPVDCGRVLFGSRVAETTAGGDINEMVTECG